MLIDNYINIFRSTGCAYAIDGKQGGRLLSPLQQVDYRDFAVDPWINPQSFTQACAANIGDNDNWNAEITFRYFGVSTVSIYGYSYNGNFYVRTMDLGTANGGVGVWVAPRFISSPVYDIVDTSGGFIVQSNGLAIKSSVFPAGEFHTINIKRTDSGAEIYFDGVLKSNVTGTINANNSAWSTYTDQGNVQSMLIKNAAENVVWQAPQSELYTGWLLKPLAQDPDGATFEIKQGYISGTVATNTGGQFTASSGEYLVSAVDLGGATSISLLWQGIIGTAGYLLQNGISAQISGDNIVISASDGTNSVQAQFTPETTSVSLVIVIDYAGQQLIVYNNGVQAATVALPSGFGDIVNNSGDNLYVYPQTALSRFAFWNRALSPEEVAAL